MRRLLVAIACAAGTPALLAGSAAAQQPAAVPPIVIDGPSADIVQPSGLAISLARDGTGGLVYLKRVGGVEHVFLSALVGGAFQPPAQVDPGPGDASQPVIAAGNGGLLVVAFISGGELYAVTRASASAPFGNPTPLASAAASPSISITNFGKAYLAFTVVDGGGSDVRAAYYNSGRWALESAPLNATPADDAGTGTGQPAVAAAGDGVAVVAWGEAGHIYSRRVWATSPSVVYEQADASLPGCSEVSADEPAVGSQGDSSYAVVAFHEVLSCGGGAPQSRVLMNRLHGSQYDGISQADGLGGSPADGADHPLITMGEYGHGWVTSSRVNSNDLLGTALGDNGAPLGTTKVNGNANVTATDGVPATAGLYSNLIAWQQNPGSGGAPEIHVRYAPNGATLGPEIVASSAAAGPADADLGLAAAGDVAGDAAVAWVKGAAGAYEIAAIQLYQPPAPFAPFAPPVQYATTAQPTLAWSDAEEPWGPITYTVTVDNGQLPQTQALSLAVPVALTDGPHRWRVTATNPAGQTAQTRTATVFVDTVPPTIQLTLTGTPLIGKQQHLRLPYGDAPPAGEPPTDASGVAGVLVNWGDGTIVKVPPGSHDLYHAYALPATYTITASVVDRAGNTAGAALSAKILKPKPKPKPKKHQKPKPKGRHR
jgi:hypothetical protein